MYQATHRLVSKVEDAEWLLDFNHPGMIYIIKNKEWQEGEEGNPDFNYFTWVLDASEYYYIEELNIVLENE